MPLFIPFLIKGAIIAAKAIVASKKASVVANMASAAIHTHGAATVAATAVTACVTIGGVYWSIERVDDLKKCFKAWEKGDYKSLTSEVASLASKIHSVGTDSIVRSGGELLKQNGYSAMNVTKFVKDTLDLCGEVIGEVRRPAIG